MPPKTQDWLKRTQARLDEALGLIHGWLELARLERGTPCEPGVSSDLGEVIAAVLEALSHQAQAAGVSVATELAPGVSAVRGDRVSVGTIISNLVSNAIKYNRVGGRVTLRTARDGNMAVVEVSDTGFGIPDESLPNLFREFYRVKNDRTRDIPGSGLGLAICKRIVADLGGTIGVHSRKDEGTTFVVRLPLGATAATEDAPPR